MKIFLDPFIVDTVTVIVIPYRYMKRKPKLVQVDPGLDRAKLTQTFLDHFGYTTREAAEILQVDHSAIVLWTGGKRQPPASAIMVMQELMRRSPAEA